MQNQLEQWGMDKNGRIFWRCPIHKYVSPFRVCEECNDNPGRNKKVPKDGVIEGYAIVDEEGDVWYTDYTFTEEEMRAWYRNQLQAGGRVAKIKVEFLGL